MISAEEDLVLEAADEAYGDHCRQNDRTDEKGARMIPGDARAKVTALWEKVQANAQALERCPGPHAFEDISPDRRFAKHWRCSACQGEVTTTQKNLYERGLAHGRASPTAH